jgi:hypothetical protein
MGKICRLGRYCVSDELSLPDIQYRPYLHILPMKGLSQSYIQYRPYLHMLPREDSVNQIYNTDPIYNCISDELSLLMVTYVDTVGIIYLIDSVFYW